MSESQIRICQQLWQLHNVALIHHNALICDQTDNQFPQQWIGRSGSNQWPGLRKFYYNCGGMPKNITTATNYKKGPNLRSFSKIC